MIVKKVATKKGAPARSRARHVRDLCDYIAGPKAGDRNEKVEHRGTINLLTLDHDAQVQEMSDLASLARSDARPIQHWILSWRPGEQPTAAQVDEAVRMFLSELGLVDHQAVYALHRNTDNWHVHLAVNRVHPETERLATVNGGFDIEVAHRAIARIEHQQGWASEDRARYRVNDLGAPERRDSHTSSDRQPGTRARDLENRTGAKSAQRIAVDDAAPLLRQARTWPELHALLAAQGLRFEKKGSGAVLWVGGTAVKASVAGRDCSLSALQKRLGEYAPPAEPILAAPRETEPVQPEVEAWTRYRQDREAHEAAKDLERTLLAGRHLGERTGMVGRHREERIRTLSGSWRGRGTTLNALRSLLAARQAKETAALRDRHARERREWRQRFPRWPDFEDWLRPRTPDLADSWRFRERVPATIESGEVAPAHAHDIRAFKGEVRGWQVLYWRLGERSARPAFTDRGRQIVLHDLDRNTVLAALQLAAQKWGTFRVSGPEAYRRMCAELAGEHGFRVTNPELQQAITSARTRHSRPRYPLALPPHEPTAAPTQHNSRPINSLPLPDASASYQRHFDDLTANSRGNIDVSRLDAVVAVRLRLTGYAPHDVERAIREAAAARGYSERRDSAEYARRTTQHAFGVSGQRAAEALAPERSSPLTKPEPTR